MQEKSQSHAVFACNTKNGVISSGRRYEMVFDFTPAKDEAYRASWEFKIPEHKVSASFLLLGQVTEPRVAFDLPSINFGKVLLGARSKAIVKLMNQEHLPFRFAFNKATYGASDEMLLTSGM